MSKDEARKRVEAVIDASDLPDSWKVVYRELLLANPEVLRRYIPTDFVDQYWQHGPAYLLDAEGGLKSMRELGFTPQSAERLMQLTDVRQLTATLTTGAELFNRLCEEPKSIPDLARLFEAASPVLRMQYIQAVYESLDAGKKARIVLQEMVNYQTGIGDIGDEEYEVSGSYTDRIVHGMSYIAKALGKEPENHLHQPPLAALEKFIRDLPVGKRFQLDEQITPAKAAMSLDQKLERPLSRREQETADGIKDKLFGPGWRTAPDGLRNG